MNKKNTYYGEFGGQYVSESLMNTLEELDEAFEAAIKDPEFIDQYNYYLKQYVGRETPLYYAERLSKKYGKSSQRPEQVSMAWQQQLAQHCLTWNAPFTWEKKILSVRH